MRFSMRWLRSVGNAALRSQGSELIGMIPAAALEASRGHDLHWLNLRPELVIENRLKGLQLRRFRSTFSRRDLRREGRVLGRGQPHLQRRVRPSKVQ